MPWLSQRVVRLAILGVCALLATMLSAHAAAPASAPAAGGNGMLYDRVVAEYLDGKWEELGADLAANAKETATLPAAQKADVDYIRKTLAECRPAWWKQCKAGGKFKFRPVVWGQTLPATFDPSLKSNVQTNYVNGVVSFTLSWDTRQMDSPAEAEHGFTQGELNNMSVWSTLGTAESWTSVPLRSQTKMDESAKMNLSRYLVFRGNATAAYYGTPRSRRWVLWLGMWGYRKEHAKDPNIMTRRAIGAMTIAELVGHPKTYPSLKLPALAPEERNEERLSSAIQNFLGHTPFTLAEDMALREALKSFCAANEAKTRVSGKITLGNGLQVSLDPAADAPLAQQRDAWCAKELAGK